MRSFYKSLGWSALLCCLVSVTNAQFTQQGPKLVGTGTIGSGWQGLSVAVSADGNTALLGRPNDNGSTGAVWVFTRSTGVWTQQGGKLVGTGASGNAGQGWSVALSADGNTALVGGVYDNGKVGAAWVFVRSGEVWSQQGNKLVGVDAIGQSWQGFSVSLSADGNTALIGAYTDNSDMGGAWVFVRSGGVWNQQGGKLVGSGASGPADQGTSVALSADGNTALVGGLADNGHSGASWVFTRSDGVWTQQGSKLIGSGAIGTAGQGCSVALSADGNTALVGGNDDNGLVGAAWVFTRSGGSWSQQDSKLVGGGAIGTTVQGLSVSLSADGNTALLGGPYDNNGVGATWAFVRSDGIWSQQGSKLVGSGATGFAFQGAPVAVSSDGHTALVAGYNDNGGLGAVWVFASPKPSTSSLTASSNPSLFGQTVTYTAAVDVGATGTVALTVDGVPQSTVALSGTQAKFTISNLSLGSHTVSAAYSGDPTFAASTSNVVNQIVNPLGVISLWQNTAVGLGQSIRLPVTLAKPALSPGVTIYLNSSDPSKVTVTPSIFIPAGKTSPNLPPVVSGLNLGTVNITATALGYSPVEQSLLVTASLAFGRCCVTISGTTTQTVPLTLSGPAPSGGLTIHLASDSTPVATIPATVTFPAKATSVNVPITGVSAGTVVIHASDLPNLTDTTVRVTVH